RRTSRRARVSPRASRPTAEGEKIPSSASRGSHAGFMASSPRSRMLASVAYSGERRMKEHFSELLEDLRRNLILMGGEVDRQIQGAGLLCQRGPGIPRSEREKIFQRFYQIDRSRSKI